MKPYALKQQGECFQHDENGHHVVYSIDCDSALRFIGLINGDSPSEGHYEEDCEEA